MEKSMCLIQKISCAHNRYACMPLACLLHATCYNLVCKQYVCLAWSNAYVPGWSVAAFIEQKTSAAFIHCQNRYLCVDEGHTKKFRLHCVYNLRFFGSLFALCIKGLVLISELHLLWCSSIHEPAQPQAITPTCITWELSNLLIWGVHKNATTAVLSKCVVQYTTMLHVQ